MIALLREAGWQVLAPEDSGDCHVVLVLVRTSKGVTEVRDARLRHTDVPIIAMTDDTDADLEIELIDGGATSILPWDAEPSAVLGAIDLAAHGLSTIETSTLTWMARHGGGRTVITEAERSWLVHLEQGVTIAELAPLAGYSERSLYRQLSSLYHRLGVLDRSGAIAEARRRGLL